MAIELKQQATIPEMLACLDKAEANNEYFADDLKGYSYERDSEFGSLNKGQAKFILTKLSFSHLCKMISVPASVMDKSNPKLADELLQEFMAQKEDKHRQKKLALKKAGPKTFLRGILPVDYADVRNSSILRPFESIADKVVVESAGWMDEADAGFLRTRFVFKESLKDFDGDHVMLGIDASSSELGMGPLQAAIMLYRLICKNGAIAVYDSKPYFFYDYSGVMSVDFEAVIRAVVERMNTDHKTYFDRVEQARLTPWTKDQSTSTVEKLTSKGDLNKGIGIKIARVLDKEEPKTQWDFVNVITSMARGYRDQLRLRYERTGGQVLGLQFPRTPAEPTWLVTERKALPASTTPTAP